jgi:ribosomal protein S18 acetylase RimI-like enzyme
MKIRKAHQKDAEEVAPLIHRAIGELADILFNTSRKQKIHFFLTKLFQKDHTRVSHHFVDVAEVGGKIGGIAISYPGNVIKTINKPVLSFCKTLHQESNVIDTNVLPILHAKEAEDDEYYLDTLAVNPNLTSNGIGTALIKHIQKKAVKNGFSKTSLLVEKDNPNAFRLYNRLGYKNMGTVTLREIHYDKMVKFLPTINTLAKSDVSCIG